MSEFKKVDSDTLKKKINEILENKQHIENDLHLLIEKLNKIESSADELENSDVKYKLDYMLIRFRDIEDEFNELLHSFDE